MTISPKVRLAMRAEGATWNAYLAQMHTMDRAILLGSISMPIVAANPALKESFMATMKLAFETLVKAGGATEVGNWGETQAAPEHERAGHG